MKKVMEGDVFHFNYSDKYRKETENRWYGGYLRHCFEGTLIARIVNNKIVLVDTYWGLRGDGKSGSAFDWRKKGTLTFYVNINDIEGISKNDCVYYADEDLYRITEQHACVSSCIHNFKRIGAEKSNAKMLETVDEEIRTQHRNVDYAVNELKRLAVKKEKIEAGDLTVVL